MLSDAEHVLLLYALGNISADAVQGDPDAFEALADPFWATFIISLDNGTMNYETYIARVIRLRDEYRSRGRRKGGYYEEILRQMRQTTTDAGDKGGRARRLEGNMGTVRGVLAKRAG